MEEFVSARRRASRAGCEESSHTAVCCCTHFVAIYARVRLRAGLMSTNNYALAYQHKSCAAQFPVNLQFA
jgi:hypothetical protein